MKKTTKIIIGALIAIFLLYTIAIIIFFATGRESKGYCLNYNGIIEVNVEADECTDSIEIDS